MVYQTFLMKYTFFLLLPFCMNCYAQPYTLRQYQVTKDSGVFISTVPNYCGRPDSIIINIYKPLGDNNVKRPVAVFAHGGSFTSTETADDNRMDVFAEEFAKRGYVAVSTDYREGFHLTAFASGLPAPANNDPSTLSSYNDYDGGVFAAAGEYVRAAYRAQQDMKAVIRWMKSRHVQDSASTCQYFIGGFSAGAILSLAAAFTDVEAEKPLQAGMLPDAINPGWLNVSTQFPGPQNRDDEDYRSHNPSPFNYDNPDCYVRPDLGSIEGNVAISSGYDANVLGVMSLSGAIGDTTLFDRFTQQPAIFLYHVPGDEVVSIDTGHPFQYLDSVFTPSPSLFAPMLYGSSWIWDKLDRIRYPGLKRKLFYTEQLPPFSPPHSIYPDVLSLCDSAARFFAEVLQTNGSCTPEYSTEYIFTGNGNWNIPANWQNNQVPVSPVSAGSHIIIRPQQGGACIINVPVTVARGAGVSVVPGASVRLPGNLIVQ